ncbi:hypothetical protein Sjap_000694 [Stephania japonica]|uniref:Protein kinase domain-containing protein n=1 Tax=Stephania japonica TaxID=461633 RepID=A0AAP0KKD8_9MAGN
MNAFRRLATSMDKFSKVASEEVPGTLSSLQLSRLEINDLTQQLSKIRSIMNYLIKSNSDEDSKAPFPGFKWIIYHGTLPDGQEVAVKVGSATSTQGTREFENELNLLSAIRHENLVPLLGYYCENDQQILVYPFMSNGSLQDCLYGEASKRKF